MKKHCGVAGDFGQGRLFGVGVRLFGVGEIVIFGVYSRSSRNFGGRRVSLAQRSNFFFRLKEKVFQTFDLYCAYNGCCRKLRVAYDLTIGSHTYYV